MPGLKTIDGLLKDLGYCSDYIPSKERYLVEDEQDKELSILARQPLGQNIDIVVPKPTYSGQSTPCKQLIDILGTRYIANDHFNTNNNKVSFEHEYKHNNEKRQDIIAEFLSTEENYVRKMHALVHTIVKPLKLSCAQDKNPILKQYMCTSIFLNLEQILELHQQFIKELRLPHNDFASTCLIFMGKMDRYRRYLLKVNDAHGLHSNEYQKNQSYRSFLIKASRNPSFDNLLFKDLLDEPWKRITAYTLLLKDIRNHTSTDHPDFDKLTDAFTQINTVASVRDDIPTILATKSHDLYLSIKKAPCHLIKQSRSLVTHLDAVEINRITGKISRHVTIFLFCDKIMVASRSSHAKGADICDGGDSPPLTSLTPKKKKSHDFKFCGWVGLEHIELFHGPSDLPGAIMVRASSDFQDSVTETGYEKYFQKGARIYSYQTESLRQSEASFMEDRNHFVDIFYKTQAVTKQYGNQDATYHRPWHGVNVYSNVYDPETYAKMEIKNNVAAILLEDDSEVDIPSLLNSNRSSPWIVALVRPDFQGLKLNIWTKVPLTCRHDQQRPSSSSSGTTNNNNCNNKSDEKQLDFATVFWNNVIKCERRLRCSSTYRLINESTEEQEMQRPPRSRSRTSMSRSTSISNISKFFGRSRSQSPFSFSSQVVPTSSLSTPSQQQQVDTDQRQRRPRAHSMTSDPVSTDHQPSKAPTTRRRKLSFDASFFKIDTKSAASSSTRQQSLQKQKPSPPRLPSPPSFSQQRRHSATYVNIPSVSRSPSPPAPPAPSSSSSSSTIHPSELPSPTVYLPHHHYLQQQQQQQQQQRYYSNGYASRSPPSPITTTPVTDSGRRRQLEEKLDAMYHDMTGLGKLGLKDNTSDPPMIRPSSRASSTSSTSPVSSTELPTPNTQQLNGIMFGTSSSRSSNYTNTFSSYTSQSSRSSLSLEEMEQFKGYSPSPRLVNTDLMNGHSQDEVDDEIARKVMTDLASSQRKWSQKSLSSHYASTIDTKSQQYQRQQRLTPTTPSPPPPPPSLSPTIPTFPVNVTPTSTTSMPTLVSTEREPAFDHVANAVDHFSYQLGSRWQFLLDKQRMLGNQVSRVAGRLPSKDTDVGMLHEVYRDTVDETSSLFNKFNTELEEIATIVNAYRQGYQYHQQRRNSLYDSSSSSPMSHMNAFEADTLLKRKLKEAQLERDYWHRRASELTNQVNEFVLRQ